MEYPYTYPFLPELMIIWHITIFYIGACVGSFLNVCIWRIPRGESIISPPSRCPECSHKLAWYENLPLIAYLCLRGKCSSCKTKISFQYFLLELLTAVMFYLVWFKVVLDHQNLLILLPYFAATMLIITTTFIDARHRVIPDLTTYPAIIAGVLFAFLYPQYWSINIHVEGWNMSIHLLGAFYSLISAFIAALLMIALAVGGKLMFKQEALGYGDVKYMVAVAALLGPRCCFFTLLAGSICASVYGVALILIKRNPQGLKTALPFGPFLAGATYIWILYSERMADFLKF